VKALYRLEGVTTESPSVKSSGDEKGVDTLLITHLFDTIEFWDCAYLFSGDGDYCPAVKALRRRGKKVIVVGVEEQMKEELIREAHSVIDVRYLLVEDHRVFDFFKNRVDSYYSSIDELLSGSEKYLSVYSNWISAVISIKEEIYVSTRKKIITKMNTFLPFDVPDDIEKSYPILRTICHITPLTYGNIKDYSDFDPMIKVF